MSHDDSSTMRDWERYRDLLDVIARAQMNPGWRGKIDLSGVVQQTLLEAHQASRQLVSCTEGQKAAWLRRALANNLNDEVRKLQTAKRGLGRERSLEAQLAESFSRLENLMPATSTTASRLVAQQERSLRVSQALASLPLKQRQVIELHHLGGRPLAEVAATLDTTKPAVAGLLHRGLKRLRELLADEG